MKIAVVVGHHERDGGAFSPFLQISEFNFYSEVVKHLQGVDVYFHNSRIKSYTQRIRFTADKLNAKDYDLVIECHFNAASAVANGCETLYYFNSAKGKDYALKFSKLVNNCTGIKLRNNGLKALVNSKDRGFASVYYPKAPAILIEPFFGSNKEDCFKIKNAQNMASIIQDFIDSL